MSYRAWYTLLQSGLLLQEATMVVIWSLICINNLVKRKSNSSTLMTSSNQETSAGLKLLWTLPENLGTFNITQTRYINTLLRPFGLKTCVLIVLPCRSMRSEVNFLLMLPSGHHRCSTHSNGERTSSCTAVSTFSSYRWRHIFYTDLDVQIHGDILNFQAPSISEDTPICFVVCWSPRRRRNGKRSIIMPFRCVDLSSHHAKLFSCCV